MSKVKVNTNNKSDAKSKDYEYTKGWVSEAASRERGIHANFPNGL